MFILLGIVVIVYLSFHSASGTEGEREEAEVLFFFVSISR